MAPVMRTLKLPPILSQGFTGTNIWICSATPAVFHDFGEAECPSEFTLLTYLEHDPPFLAGLSLKSKVPEKVATRILWEPLQSTESHWCLVENANPLRSTICTPPSTLYALPCPLPYSLPLISALYPSPSTLYPELPTLYPLSLPPTLFSTYTLPSTVYSTAYPLLSRGVDPFDPCTNPAAFLGLLAKSCMSLIPPDILAP